MNNQKENVHQNHMSLFGSFPDKKWRKGSVKEYAVHNHACQEIVESFCMPSYFQSKKSSY